MERAVSKSRQEAERLYLSRHAWKELYSVSLYPTSLMNVTVPGISEATVAIKRTQCPHTSVKGSDIDSPILRKEVGNIRWAPVNWNGTSPESVIQL